MAEAATKALLILAGIAVFTIAPAQTDSSHAVIIQAWLPYEAAHTGYDWMDDPLPDTLDELWNDCFIVAMGNSRAPAIDTGSTS